MKIDFDVFADQVILELKNTGSDFWNNFSQTDKIFIEERARRLVDLYAERIESLDNNDRIIIIDQNIAAVLNTLTSIAALVQYKAELVVRQAIANTMKKAAAFAFSALGAL